MFTDHLVIVNAFREYWLSLTAVVRIEAEPSGLIIYTTSGKRIGSHVGAEEILGSLHRKASMGKFRDSFHVAAAKLESGNVAQVEKGRWY